MLAFRESLVRQVHPVLLVRQETLDHKAQLVQTDCRELRDLLVHRELQEILV